MDRYKEKIKCEKCGVEYIKCNKSHHNKTKRHLDALKNEKIEELSTVENLGKIEIKNKIIKEEVEKNKRKMEDEMIKKLKVIMEKKIEDLIKK